MNKEPFIAHSELTNEIYIICGAEKYLVTEQVIKAMQNTGRLEQQPCDDCVSRQTVVEYIKTCDAELGHDSENEAVVEDILNMPPVTPIVKWIPVSEKLPEEGKEVLAYYEYFRYGDYNCMQTTYGVGYQYDGLWCGDIRGHKLNVIAWQPLPEAYKEK